MDPNETLRELRVSIRKFREVADGSSGDAEHEAANEVVDKVEALDGWLTRDGFLPLDWQLGNLVAEYRLRLGEHDVREAHLHELLAEAESDPSADVAADDYRHYDYLESCEEALAVARRLLDALGCKTRP